MLFSRFSRLLKGALSAQTFVRSTICQLLVVRAGDVSILITHGAPQVVVDAAKMNDTLVTRVLRPLGSVMGEPQCSNPVISTVSDAGSFFFRNSELPVSVNLGLPRRAGLPARASQEAGLPAAIFPSSLCGAPPLMYSRLRIILSIVFDEALCGAARRDDVRRRLFTRRGDTVQLFRILLEFRGWRFRSAHSAHITSLIRYGIASVAGFTYYS